MKELLGKAAPAFSLKDKDGVEHSLKENEAEYTVLYFYPKDNTPGCTTEAKEFSAIGRDLKKRDARCIGISGGDEKSKAEFCRKHSLDLLLLSDPDGAVARKFGAWGEKEFLGNKYEGVSRKTFVLDRSLRIIKVWDSVKAAGHAGEVLQYINRHKAPEHGDAVNVQDKVQRGHSHKRAEKDATRIKAFAARSAFGRAA